MEVEADAEEEASSVVEVLDGLYRNDEVRCERRLERDLVA